MKNTDKTHRHLLLQQIRLENILSFGPGSPQLELQNLNILIGPNATGKSNLIDALSMLRATPVSGSASNMDLRGVVRRGGGVREWVWKGGEGRVASIEVVVGNPKRKQSLRHFLSFRDEQGLRLEDERIENAKPYGELSKPYFYYRFNQGHPVVNTRHDQGRKLARETVNTELSILAQRRDPEQYPEFTHLADFYDNIRIYREWAFGRTTVLREPQMAEGRRDRLEEDFSNLGVFLNGLQVVPKAKAAILDGLKDLYEGVSDFGTLLDGRTVQVFFSEGDFSIPATRLSDGTLHYLCLLAILCDPNPPPLICIEEPELGLHPDILPKLADLLVQASQRTQLIVTTHSDVLVDAMTEHPEAVVVCEKRERQTWMCRLKKEELASWLDKYRLGQLWISGQIGGTRW